MVRLDFDFVVAMVGISCSWYVCCLLVYAVWDVVVGASEEAGENLSLEAYLTYKLVALLQPALVPFTGITLFNCSLDRSLTYLNQHTTIV